jgi:hypothetical protein
MSDESKSSISQASSYEEMADFWDEHSLADFDEQTYEVDIKFDPAARTSYVNIETELLAELRQIAHTHKVSTETLVNLWLRERVEQARPTS